MSDTAVAAQDAYASQLANDRFPFTLAVGAAFVRGMREVGYRNTATALCELIDNAEEAQASEVHIVFGYERGEKKPTQIAIIDDGHGMSPTMLRASVLWGGTHREDGRDGLGRFGYGLPSSCVSQGRAFTVYSKRKQQAWHKVGIDLDEISDGLFTTDSGHIVVPPAQKASLPEFVQEYLDNQWGGEKLRSGTVVVIDKLDRVDRKTTSKLIELLVTHFAITYHKLIGEFAILVDGHRVDPIDPLFLTPSHRWYDHDTDRAKPLPPIEVTLKETEARPGGRIRVRLSFLPYTFHLNDKSRAGRAGSNFNGRFHIMRDYNGIVIARNGRVIETKTTTPWTRFQNNDRHVRVELDFEATLDDEFRINTSKQRVEISDRIWDTLRQAGLEEAIRQARRMYAEDKVRSDVEHARDETGLSAAEKILARLNRPAEDNKDAEKSVWSSDDSSTPHSPGQGRLNLGDALYKIGQRPTPGGRFFEIDQVDGTRILWINTEHAFYRDIYAHPDLTPWLRHGLELMLYTAGDKVLRGRGGAVQTLNKMIEQWSEDLANALDELSDVYEPG